MHININNIYSYVKESTAEERQYLHRLLSVRMQGYEFTTAFRKGHWDGYYHFFNPESGAFLTGFLPTIIDEFTLKKWHVTGTYKNTSFNEKFLLNITKLQEPTRSGKTLRPYQIDAIHTAVTHTLKTYGGSEIVFPRGIIKIPTGGGKTAVAARIIHLTQLKTLFLVEKRDSLHQTKEEFEEWTDQECGIIGDSIFEPKHITIATIQTLRLRMKELKHYFPTVQMLMTDEAHHESNNDYHKIAVRCVNAQLRYGISATPLVRNDIGDCYLVGDTGSIIVDVPRKLLENKGYLAQAKIYFFTINEPLLSRAKYPVAYKQCIVENETRNKEIVKRVVQLYKKDCIVLVLTVQEKHGKLLCDMINKAGIQTYFVYGKDSTKYRRSLLDGLGKGHRVLIASVIFDEAVDVPMFNALVLAGAGKSDKKAIQRVGRVVRPKATGKNVAYVVDFIDRTNKYLLEHSMARMNTFEGEGFTISIIQ